MRSCATITPGTRRVCWRMNNPRARPGRAGDVDPAAPAFVRLRVRAGLCWTSSRATCTRESSQLGVRVFRVNTDGHDTSVVALSLVSKSVTPAPGVIEA